MCQFNIAFTGSPEELLTRASQAIEAAGGEFSGSTSAGLFRAKTPLGTIHGSYEMLDQQLALVISKKPFLLSCKRIEKELSGMIT